MDKPKAPAGEAKYSTAIARRLEQALPTGDFQGLLHRLTFSGHPANLA